MIRKLLGIAPQPDGNGAYIPSKLSLKLATSSKTDYKPVDGKGNSSNKGKIMVLCTEEDHLEMANGKLFSTGNHPVEMFVPMLHFRDAGFDMMLFTSSGKPVKLEMWAMPSEDQNVQDIYAAYKSDIESPASLADFISGGMADGEDYEAVFIPGGHGALLGLPDNPDVGKMLHWCLEDQKFILSICHGPAALLAAKTGQAVQDFIFRDYEIAAFPDSVDRQSPLIGYMPGKLTWAFGKELKKLGVRIINKKADRTCHVDRRLITGASPDAADDFGRLAVETMLSIPGQ